MVGGEFGDGGVAEASLLVVAGDDDGADGHADDLGVQTAHTLSPGSGSLSRAHQRPSHASTVRTAVMADVSNRP